jgi:hypothetical protein
MRGVSHANLILLDWYLIKSPNYENVHYAVLYSRMMLTASYVSIFFSALLFLNILNLLVIKHVDH